MTQTMILPAAVVHTMDPNHPQAEAVAVRDGWTLALGTVDDLQAIDGAAVDNRYADKVLLPGASLSDELVQDRPNLGAGFIEAVSYLAASMLIGLTL